MRNTIAQGNALGVKRTHDSSPERAKSGHSHSDCAPSGLIHGRPWSQAVGLGFRISPFQGEEVSVCNAPPAVTRLLAYLLDVRVRGGKLSPSLSAW